MYNVLAPCIYNYIAGVDLHELQPAIHHILDSDVREQAFRVSSSLYAYLLQYTFKCDIHKFFEVID